MNTKMCSGILTSWNALILKIRFIHFWRFVFICHQLTELWKNGCIKSTNSIERPKGYFFKAHFSNTTDIIKSSSKRKSKQKGIDNWIVFKSKLKKKCVNVQFHQYNVFLNIVEDVYSISWILKNVQFSLYRVVIFNFWENGDFMKNWRKNYI